MQITQIPSGDPLRKLDLTWWRDVEVPREGAAVAHPPAPDGPCADCRGTGKTVLLTSIEPCRICDGSGTQSPVYTYDVTAPPEAPAGGQSAASAIVIVRG